MESPLTLQPRPPRNRGPQTVAEFIQRINAEPGGFRRLNEADLQVPEAVTARSDGTGDDHDVEMADIADPDNAPKSKDIVAARHELLGNIMAARQSAMLSLDFISLLLSKENPVQAAATLTPHLRTMVGIGTLGATTLEGPTTLTQTRIPDNKMIAIGKRLIDGNKAADTALSAAKRLQKEITLETKYWAEVLAVSEKGWSAFRLPQEPHTMGVKFGFSSAAPEFKAKSVAPMRRAEDGAVRLEHGRMSSEPTRLQVRISQNGQVVGSSSLPQALPEDAPLEDRVKEARDTIFAYELWHELNREGRTLLGHDVRLEKSVITYRADPTRTLIFRLVSLGDDQEDPSGPLEPAPEDDDAESLNLVLHLLLANAHRQNELKRSKQSAPNATKGPPPPYSLLLPIVTYYRHENALKECTNFLSSYSRVLRSAGLNASLTVTEAPISQPSAALPSEALISNLLHPSEVQFDITITPDSRVRLIARPSSAYGTRFLVFLLPSTRAGARNPLSLSFPPASQDSQTRAANIIAADFFYDNTKELFWYLQNAVPRALALHYAPIIQELKAASPDPTNWIIDFSGKGLVDDDTERFGVRFEFALDSDTRCTELRVSGDYRDAAEGREIIHRDWRWSVADGREDNGGSLEEIVRHVLFNGPGGSGS
ncbi:subunit 17 of mediator complex-domain-containing protein [Podospora appendiculata]|uniref:Mediator of RNA polymerase II transcription subunit 17 n=1 Tax=Podospora appendiculata TaxID=314037 RepID=A0AAE0XHM1_9PEZI|nr:subunit 17 of mediator complex-domain-containing protein [Podospora appendiculata]